MNLQTQNKDFTFVGTAVFINTIALILKAKKNNNRKEHKEKCKVRKGFILLVFVNFVKNLRALCGFKYCINHRLHKLNLF